MRRNNKNRIIAALLAFVGGTMGVHKLYLGDVSGFIFYLFLMIVTAGMSIPITGILGVFDAIRLLNMSNDQFDRKYNNVPSHSPYRKSRGRTATQRTVQREVVVDRTVKKRHNPFIKTAKQFYKEYALEEAADHFEQAIAIDGNNQEVLFNMASVYSLLEEKDKSMSALRRLLDLGYKDIEKIETHDDLAFIRIQPEFEALKSANYETSQVKNTTAPKQEKDLLQDDLLLSQLNKLSELRKKGLLSEKEFSFEKEKLLRR